MGKPEHLVFCWYTLILFTNFTNSITPWIDNLGYQNCFISAAFVGLACAAVFLVMAKFGKTCRIRSQKTYWRIVQENWEKGMGH